MATEHNDFDDAHFDYGDIPLESNDNTPSYGLDFSVRDMLSTPKRKVIAGSGLAGLAAVITTSAIMLSGGGDSHEADNQIRISELSAVTTEEPVVTSTVPEEIITIAQQPTTTMMSVETAPATLPAGESLPEIADPAITIMIEGSPATATVPAPTAVTVPPTTELVTTTELPAATTEAPTTTTEAPATTEPEIITVAETSEAPRTTLAPETTLWTVPEIIIENPIPSSMPEWEFDCDEPTIYVPNNVGRFWIESLAEACHTTVERLSENTDGLDPNNLIAEQAVNLWPSEEPEDTEPAVTSTEAPETTIFIPETTEAPETTVAITEAPETTIAVTTTAATTSPPTTVATTPPPSTTIETTIPATSTTVAPTTVPIATTTLAPTTSVPEVRVNSWYSEVDCNAQVITVQEGMWPGRVAGGCGMAVESLVEINTQECDLLGTFYPGEQLYLQPGIAPVVDCEAPATSVAATPGTTSPASSETTQPPASTEAPTSSAPTVATPELEYNTIYPWENCDSITVKPGMSSGKIAIGCHVSLDQLAAANPHITPISNIHPGDVLAIPQG